MLLLNIQHSLQEGVEPLGADGWEMARVLAGRPKAGAELAEDYNPLEAGLYAACSLTKGCSIGQETISKVGGACRCWPCRWPASDFQSSFGTLPVPLLALPRACFRLPKQLWNTARAGRPFCTF